jgi:DNA-nicking Smr family endonuclease
VKKKDGLSNIDKAQWEEYLKDPKDIFDKDQVEKKFFKKSRFQFDLHGFTLLDANQKIRELIIDCQAKGYIEILLITGKGLHSNTDQNTYVSKELSKLKFSIPEYINTNRDLSDKIFSIERASVTDGGEGAIIIKLKKL